MEITMIKEKEANKKNEITMGSNFLIDLHVSIILDKILLFKSVTTTKEFNALQLHEWSVFCRIFDSYKGDKVKQKIIGRIIALSTYYSVYNLDQKLVYTEFNNKIMDSDNGLCIPLSGFGSDLKRTIRMDGFRIAISTKCLHTMEIINSANFGSMLR
ncbi:hypothetical protein RhiirC2_865798 [Rhizophagus irregularis]|uniref:Uncharacterized protein n=1 Tax=Rhizophagus irregularis TaxID=588596 RepID=A0A2N1NBC9_9GLOM|nr:hypothetical protein RhiirC2_865798 [Rhizophagus irregularis]